MPIGISDTLANFVSAPGGGGILHNVKDREDTLIPPSIRSRLIVEGPTRIARSTTEQVPGERISGDVVKSIILPTAIKITQTEIDYWTNMTCFYDKNWVFNPKLSTTPISFMHITSVTETITAQGAEKRVIVYEAPKSSDGQGKWTGAGALPVTSHPAYKNNLEVIMDNVVVQPKQYQMEVVIPDTLIGPYITQGLRRLTALIDFMGKTYGGTASWLDSLANTMQNVQVGMKVAQEGLATFERLIGSFVGSTQIATINRNSIEAMANSGHMVLLKKWNGYNFAYGIFTKIELSKKPTERNVTRGSLTFQEAPVLNITPKQAPKGVTSSLSSVASIISEGVNQAARIANLAVAYPFILLTGVMGEAGAVGSDEPGSALGSWNVF